MRVTGADPGGIGGVPRTYAFLLVRVDTDAGIHGIGEALDFPGVRAVLDGADAWLRGRDPLRIGPIVRGLLYGALPSTAPLPAPSIMSATATVAGPPAWAAAGLEIALWDLAGKALGAPVHQLLGGAYRDRIRVYLDRSFVADVADPGAWARLGERAVVAGFDWLKLDLEQIAPDHQADPWSRQIGSAALAAIRERVGAVRDAIGPAVDLALDGHMSHDVESAIRVGETLADLGLRWYEDPVPVTSMSSLARVRDAQPIPIAAGETFTAEQFRAAFEAGALDIAHPDVLFIGGLAEGRRATTLADLWNAPVAFHDNGAAVATIATAHLAAATPNLLGMEYHFFDATWAGSLAQRDVPLFRDGGVPLTDAPGLGLELDETVCRAHLAPGEAWFGD
jgi:L-alanine-DL-glutamate epimerase-like enolase superfamily enzyme